MAIKRVPVNEPRRKAVWGVRITFALAVLTLGASAQPRADQPLGSLARLHMRDMRAAAFASLESGTNERSAQQESGFSCGLLGFGTTQQSHATMSASGNQSLHCSGETPLQPDRAVIIEGTPCLLHFDDEVTSDSRLVITPSGNVILTCHFKN
jgi:hypothetical protein